MIRRRFYGIFGKVFLYTMLILLFVIGGMFLLFSNQVQSAIELTQQQQFSEAVTGFVEQTRGRTTEDIIVLMEDFHRWNASLEMRLISEAGDTLFQTDGFESSTINIGVVEAFGGTEISNDTAEILLDRFNEYNGLSIQRFQIMQQAAFIPLENGLHLQVSGSLSGVSIYREVLGGAAWIFGIIVLVSLIAAFFFAGRIAKPIQRVSSDTHIMSQLLPIDPPKERNDEIGQLSKDVYIMYNRLKSTVSQLETEIERVKRMEENQRYFFSAASHELKTPITAVGGIFEGMLSDIITPEEYTTYLKEGMKLVNEQNKLVSEILELVKLGGELPGVEIESINIRKCLECVIEQLSTFIESKEQTLTIDVAEGIICQLNDKLFSKVLSNVLLNAAQNSPELAEIRITAEEKSGLVLLTVHNGETEIPGAIISNIYEPFYRADEARTSGDGRSGLGLTIVKKALDLMGIAFEIRNIDDGVEFRMNIPTPIE